MGFTGKIDATRDDIRAALAGRPEAETVDRDLEEAVGFIRDSITKMNGLVAAILKVSREGRRRFTPEPLAMTPLVRGLADAIRRQTAQEDAVIEVQPDLPEVTADRFAVERVRDDLLDNAIKYLAPNHPDRIVVSGERAGGRVVYRVADNGRGIADADRARVFELFRRAGTQDRPDDGIGLARVRATVHALGGRIDLTSLLDVGSIFTVSLPTAASVSHEDCARTSE